MEEVLEKCIKPFLLGKTDDQLYLVKLGKEKIDYEQHLRIHEKERKKRDKIAKLLLTTSFLLWDLQNDSIKITLALQKP